MVRDATEEDLPEIQSIFSKMGMDYALPDLRSPLFFVRKVRLDGQGNVIAACFLRLTAETYLWLDQDLKPREMMAAMQELQPEVLQSAWKLGIDDIEARIPETTEKRFHKRLIQLGWSKNRSGWNPWSRQTQ